jgi:hypothetical protein
MRSCISLTVVIKYILKTVETDDLENVFFVSAMKYLIGKVIQFPLK